MNSPSDKLTPNQLVRLFLFEELDDGQLAWIAHHGHVERYRAGRTVYREGEPGLSFFVLLAGTITLSRHLHGSDIELSRTNQAGTYAGATRAYLRHQADHTYPYTLYAATDLEMFVLPAEEFAYAVRTWFPMAAHLLDGLAFMTRRSIILTTERERLLSLGSLAAGLTHELNNPAAAAASAAAELGGRVVGLEDAVAAVLEAQLTPAAFRQLSAALKISIESSARGPETTLLDASDAEDELGDWLAGQGVSQPWDVASTLTAAGVSTASLGRATEEIPSAYCAGGLHLITALLNIRQLASEVEAAIARLGSMVTAAQAYAQMDRTARQTVDVRELLDATLVVMRHAIPATVQIIRHYPDPLPLVLANGAELNQVWTRLIDNAVAAMDGHGSLTLTCSSDEGHLHVDVTDTGTGIPPENRTRIFDPFFTTRPPGQGIGLGLTVVHEVVALRHGGTVTVSSQPGETRFRVSLPLQQ